LAAVISLSASAAWAETGAESAGASADEASGATLETVVVTARKRSENLQATPLSISAFNSNGLTERNVQQASDITSYVPNVQFDSGATESGGGASTQIAIRGIGQVDYVLTVEPGVGVYMDGVYIGKSVGSMLDTVDVERMEVLRGPQGTLFGRNTIGGAVQIISKRPSDTLEYFVEGTAGSYNRRDVKAGVSGPLSDFVKVRLTGGYVRREGYIKRLNPDGSDSGQRDGDQDRLSGRFIAEIQPVEALTATVSLDGTRIRESSAGSVQLVADETGGFAGAYNAGVAGGACLPAAGDARLSNPYCYNSQYVRPLNSLTTYDNGKSKSDVDVWGASLTLNWKAGFTNLKSITAYRHVDSEIAHGLTGSPYYVNQIGQSISTAQFSQELQAAGNLFDGKLKYVGGIFYLHETGTQVFPVYNSIVQFDSGGTIDNTSYAAFGQTTYDITRKLDLTVGLRYTSEQRTFNPALQHIVSYSSSPGLTPPGWVDVLAGAFGPAGTPLFPAGDYRRDSDSFTPMATLNYKVTPDVMAYVSYSKGFKGGGFTMRYFPPVVPAAGTDPDSIISYAGPEKATTTEIGLKTESFDHRLRLNLTGFYTNYTGIQITYNIDPDGAGPIGAFVPVLANAGTAHIKGFEAEGSLVAAEWLRFDGSLGVIDARYVAMNAAVQAAYPGAVDFRLPNTPKFTGNIGATATLADNDLGRTSVRVDYGYRSGQFKEFTNNAATFQPAYGLLNASVTFRSAKGPWEVTAGGTNLTDKIYLVSAVPNPGLGIVQGTPSRPREVYVKLRYKY
jgi:iron complex outermembrane receptor protein